MPEANLVAMSQISAFQDRLQAMHRPGGLRTARTRLAEATPGKIETRIEQAFGYLSVIDSVRNGLERGNYETPEGAAALKRDLAMAQLMSFLVNGHGILLIVDALTQRIKGETHPMAGFCHACNKHQVGHKDLHDNKWYCDQCGGGPLDNVSVWTNKKIEGFQRFTMAEQMADMVYLNQFVPPLVGMMMDIGTKIGAFTSLNDKGEVVIDGTGQPVIFPDKWIPDSLMESLEAEVADPGEDPGEAVVISPDEAILDEAVLKAIENLGGKME